MYIYFSLAITGINLPKVVCRKMFVLIFCSHCLKQDFVTCEVNWYLTNLPALGSTASPLSPSPSPSSEDPAGLAISNNVVEVSMSRILNLKC